MATLGILGRLGITAVLDLLRRGNPAVRDSHLVPLLHLLLGERGLESLVPPYSNDLNPCPHDLSLRQVVGLFALAKNQCVEKCRKYPFFDTLLVGDWL